MPFTEPAADPATTGVASITRDILLTTLALALGAGVAIGIARFAYALLLPPMRADLGWSWFTGGAMGTANAAGYLVGALAMPWVMSRYGSRAGCVGGTVATAVLLALHGLVRLDAALYALRAIAGAASAAVFVSGGLLAARVAMQLPTGSRVSPGLVLGLYYGGAGWGIVASALLVAPLVATTGRWPAAWLSLGALAIVAAIVMGRRLRSLPEPRPTGQPKGRLRARAFGFAMAGYFMFGLGYIGYMTFIVSLLREQAMSTSAVTGFYVVLGLGVAVSPFLWAGLLQRHRDGRPLAVLNGLLALATALPVAWVHPVAAYASGALFGAVFLSVVAATTAIVRHNLPAEHWAAGVSAFTIIFAIGQIVGPSLVGWLADGSGGLTMGLGVSAGLLAAGAVLALLQRVPTASH